MSAMKSRDKFLITLIVVPFAAVAVGAFGGWLGFILTRPSTVSVAIPEIAPLVEVEEQPQGHPTSVQKPQGLVMADPQTAVPLWVKPTSAETRGALAALDGVIQGFEHQRDAGLSATWPLILDTLREERYAIEKDPKLQ